MRPFTFQIRPESYLLLQDFAEDCGMSTSQLVRELVEDFLERKPEFVLVEGQVVGSA